MFENCSHIIVEGIGVRSYHTWWQTLFLNSRDISVRQMNIFGVGVNTDGVDILHAAAKAALWSGGIFQYLVR